MISKLYKHIYTLDGSPKWSLSSFMNMSRWRSWSKIELIKRSGSLSSVYWDDTKDIIILEYGIATVASLHRKTEFLRRRRHELIVVTWFGFRRTSPQHLRLIIMVHRCPVSTTSSWLYGISVISSTVKEVRLGFESAVHITAQNRELHCTEPQCSKNNSAPVQQLHCSAVPGLFKFWILAKPLKTGANR